jgi:hypothetical protein
MRDECRQSVIANRFQIYLMVKSSNFVFAPVHALLSAVLISCLYTSVHYTAQNEKLLYLEFY